MWHRGVPVLSPAQRGLTERPDTKPPRSLHFTPCRSSDLQVPKNIMSLELARYRDFAKSEWLNFLKNSAPYDIFLVVASLVFIGFFLLCLAIS